MKNTNCLNCQKGRITCSLEGFAKEKKIKPENLQSRYCQVKRIFVNVSFGCKDFTEKELVSTIK
jgi:hypothetical protein